jgi:D-aspartate ligase
MWPAKPRSAQPRSSTLAKSELPGAVVLGGDYQGLGIVRSLGRMGVPVLVLDDERSISRFSRYATLAFRVANLRDAQATVDTLIEIGARHHLEGWVVYPTRDEQVAALSLHRAVLCPFYRIPAPAWETVQYAWDKRKTYELAKLHKIPVPRTWIASGFRGLDELDLPFPLVLKPAIKENFFYQTHAKAWCIRNRAELRDLYRRANRFLHADEILLQEFIPGDGRHQFSYCAFFKCGKGIATMVARRRRQHPHDFGRASTYVETIELPAVETLAERFLRAINYYGLVEVEFKMDPRDGQLKLLDVNARTWGYHALGFTAGVDFCRLLYLDQVGRRVESCRSRPGISWIRLLTDLPTGLLDILSGRLRSRDYWTSVRSFHIEAVLNFEDPLPALAEVALLPYLTFKRGF